MSKHNKAREALAENQTASRNPSDSDLSDFGGEVDRSGMSEEEIAAASEFSDEKADTLATENVESGEPAAIANQEQGQSAEEKRIDEDAAAAEGKADEADKPEQSPRMQALNKIADRNREDRLADYDLIDNPNVTAPTGDDDSAAAAELSEDDAAEAAAAAELGIELEDAAAAAPAKGYEIREVDGVDHAVTKVDGEEKLIPMTALIAGSQKYSSASAQLEKASATVKNLATWNETLNGREANLKSNMQKLLAIKPNSESSEGEPSEQDASKLNETATRFVDAVYSDDTDGAVEAITALLAGRGDAATPMDKEEITALVTEIVNDQQSSKDQQTDQSSAIQDQAVATDTQIDDAHKQDVIKWEADRATFVEEFPDIKQGSNQWKLTAKYSVDIASEPEFKDASHLERFREAGNRTRALVKEVSGKSNSRVARKLNSQQHVSSKSSLPSSSGKSQEQEPQSQSSMIRDMHNRRRPTQKH